MLKGRLRFFNGSGSRTAAPFPSAWVVWYDVARSDSLGPARPEIGRSRVGGFFPLIAPWFPAPGPPPAARNRHPSRADEPQRQASAQ